ncbi:hypothetical protein LZ32DRAFT_321995 [Colletotrichum eremochloae]|nr:hypothetical protein LZ32DRAFT_321995 [Colletotrichum eremochloae]
MPSLEPWSQADSHLSLSLDHPSPFFQDIPPNALARHYARATTWTIPATGRLPQVLPSLSGLPEKPSVRHRQRKGKRKTPQSGFHHTKPVHVIIPYVVRNKTKKIRTIGYPPTNCLHFLLLLSYYYSVSLSCLLFNSMGRLPVFYHWREKSSNVKAVTFRSSVFFVFNNYLHYLRLPAEEKKDNTHNHAHTHTHIYPHTHTQRTKIYIFLTIESQSMN